MGETKRNQRAAFIGFIAKPFDLEELIDIVNRAVEEPSAVLRLKPSNTDVLFANCTPAPVYR